MTGSSNSQAPKTILLSKRSEYILLAIVLVVGFAHGLIYVFIMPPWQHYDEPNHFEYSWLIANRGRLPNLGDYDQGMRRTVALSMIESDFFRGLDFAPDLASVEEPIWIGQFSQLADPPLYYIIGALPLFLIQTDEVDTQLYAVRLVSLLLYLLSIFFAWGAIKEITSDGNPLRIIVPLTIALLPGFTDVMTSVNNIVGATAIFSLFIWGSLRLIVRGFSWINFLWAGAAVLLCLWTSVTVYASIPLFLVSLLFSIFRGSFRWVPWSIFVLGGLASLILVFSWGDPRGWYRSILQDIPVREVNTKAVSGEYVFQVDSQGIVSPEWVGPLFQSVGKDLPSGAYTFGAWMWASQAIRVQTPIIGTGGKSYSENVDLGLEPRFFAMPFTLAAETPNRVWIMLAPEAGRSQTGIVYYDGLVLSKGERPVETPPIFFNSSGSEGTWGDSEFINLIKNPSAEEAGVQIQSWANRVGGRIIPDDNLPSLLMTYITDWSGAGWHYRLVIENLFQTFWGKFGWGQVSLTGRYSFTILLVINLLAFLGLLIWFTRQVLERGLGQSQVIPFWETVFFLAIILLILWGGAMIRGASYLPYNRLYLPVARYVYPSIIPTVMTLSLGIVTFLGWVFSRIIKEPRQVLMVVFGITITGLLILDLASIISVLSYYG